ncbi:MAG: DUF1351 domain-containing protein [Alphaproteobacteria bacterium]
MEIIILNPTEDKGFLKSIEFNKEEIKKELSASLEKYKGLTYSENEIKDAKSDRATLNKFKAAIEEKRKEIKKKCLEPYEAFEKDIKEIVSMIDEPILAIDTQVKNFENSQKEEKKAQIHEFWDNFSGGLKELIQFETIFNEKWLNATVKIASVNDEINEFIERTEKDLKVITDLKSEFESQIKDFYLKNFDLSAALQEKNRLEEQRAKLKAYEESKIALTPQPAVEAKTDFIQTPIKQAEQPESLQQIDFRVWVSEKQKQDLKEFLTKNNIKYGSVK